MIIIVGIDPGTTTGIAAVDTKGQVVAAESKKEMGLSKVARYIMDQGTPVIIATDVSPAPSFVKKVASTFGAELFVPDGDMSVRRKNRLTQEYSNIELSDHSMDALAAALQAYRKDKQFIDRIKRKSEELGIEESEHVMKTALKERKSVSKIIASLESEEKEHKEEKVPERNVDWEKRYRKTKKELEKTRKENRRLKDYSEDLKKQKEEAEKEKEKLEKGQKSRIARDREVKKWRKRFERVLKEKKQLENNLKGARSNISKQAEALEKILSGATLFRICNSREEVEKTEKPILFLHTGVRFEPPSHVTVAVVTRENDQEFYQERGIKTVLMEELPGIKLSNYYVVKENKIFRKIEDRTEKFIDWLEDYRDRDD